MQYLEYQELCEMHVALMCDVMHETFYGVLNRGLLESALARPRNAALYEGASALRQAAFLFQGLLMNHGFKQGNKRTAFLALGWFLHQNSIGSIVASENDIITMCYSAENDKWSVDQIEAWLVANVKPDEPATGVTS